MLSRSFTAVVERSTQLRAGSATEPYETAWAREGRWFVHLPEAPAASRLVFRAQTSPEGLTWCAHEAPSVTLTGPGLATLPLANLGPWQRLIFEVAGDEAVTALVYLTLKG